MSELINENDNRTTIRWKLLTGVSALALTAYVSSTGLARAEDTGQPQIWIELGGQLSRLQESQEAFAPPIMDSRPSIFDPSQKFEKPPTFGFDEFGAISFRPDNSNWLFTASIRYGRSTANRHVSQQTSPKPFILHYTNGYPPRAFNALAQKFAETRASNSEKHFILDFAAGKDVGLGMLGSKDITSVISAGVRFAQFGSKSNISLKSDPDWHFSYIYSPFLHLTKTNGQPFHTNLASMTATRSFHGVGPSFSWNGSAPFAGNAQDGEITFDWGVGGAVLFGRQKAKTSHETKGRGPGTFRSYYTSSGYTYTRIRHGQVTLYRKSHDAPLRSRRVTVPEISFLAGLSYRYTDAKISIGYRYDTFLDAMDTGIDATKKSNVTFNGPYASISVGIGD